MEGILEELKIFLHQTILEKKADMLDTWYPMTEENKRACSYFKTEIETLESIEAKIEELENEAKNKELIKDYYNKGMISSFRKKGYKTIE